LPGKVEKSTFHKLKRHAKDTRTFDAKCPIMSPKLSQTPTNSAQLVQNCPNLVQNCPNLPKLSPKKRKRHAKDTQKTRGHAKDPWEGQRSQGALGGQRSPGAHGPLGTQGAMGPWGPQGSQGALGAQDLHGRASDPQGPNQYSL
jgi:hypothetical protein